MKPPSTVRTDNGTSPRGPTIQWQANFMTPEFPNYSALYPPRRYLANLYTEGISTWTPESEERKLPKIGPYEIELVPSTSWGRSLAALAEADHTFRRRWTEIRTREIARARYRCEYCMSNARTLIRHEVWSYDGTTFTQRLTGYKISCRDCNLILHLRQASDKGLDDRALDHFVRVTGMSRKELMDTASQAYAEWAERSTHAWHIDVSNEPLAKGYEEKVNQLQNRATGDKRLWIDYPRARPVEAR